MPAPLAPAPQSAKRILLTGITGNLGALATLELLAQGHEVYAPVRSRRSGHLVRQRALDALSALDDPRDLRDAIARRLIVVNADITDSSAALERALTHRIDETWHFASSLKYMPKDRDEIYAANVGGLQTVMQAHAARAAPNARMFYVSTAYSAGKSLERIPEARIACTEDLAFNNEYEKSKLIAENDFLDAIESGSVDGAVFRPSIVTARPGGGRLVNYNGYYLGLKAWMALSDHMASQGRAGDRVRVWIDPENTLNVISLDDVIRTMLALSAAGAGGGAVFNVVNRSAATLAQVFETFGRHLQIEPVLVGSSGSDRADRTTFEKLVAYSLTYTAPYLKQRLIFESDRTCAAIGSAPDVPMYPQELEDLTRHYFDRFGQQPEAP